MFSMYDDDGLNFRNNIDHLYSVHQLASSQKIKKKPKEDDPEREKFEDSLYKGHITKQATNAYKQVNNLEHKTDLYHVEQIMSHRIVTIDDSKPILECYDIMKENEIQQIPVIAENKLHLKGIVSRHDILKYLVAHLDDQEAIQEATVADIYSKKVITTDPISDIRGVSQVMIDFNLNAIPVVNSSDILVGMISRNDIVKAVSSLPHLQLWG